MMKKILIITQEIPYPLTTGGVQGVFHFIEKLRCDYQISVLFPLFRDVEKLALIELKKRWDNVNFYVYEGENSTVCKQKTLGQIYQNIYSFPFKIKNKLQRKGEVSSDIDPVRNSSTLNTSVHIVKWQGYINFITDVVKNDFDIVQIEFYDFISLVHVLPQNVEKIFVHHELRYVRNAIEMSFFKEKYPYDEYMFNLSKHYELASLKLYDKIITVTDTDRDKLRKELPEIPIFSSPLMVDLPDDVTEYKYEFNNKLIFVASSSHFPNLDGIRWFISEIWPLLHNRYPMLELHLVGRGWNAEMFSNLNIQNVYFDGFVDKLSSVMPNSLSIVPIRIGSGMRMKILEAVHYRIPFVTTTVGVEGLNFQNEKDCFIADSPDDFFTSICKLIEDKGFQDKFIESASDTLRNNYSSDILTKIRSQIYETKLQK